MNGIRRFACTQCGACCNRSPEVELSEAAALADVFVWRLMFRVFSLPAIAERGGNVEAYYQRKRLLAAHAARKYPRRVMRGGKAVEHANYLMISAVAVDTSSGRCAALESRRCSIHDRRPLTCRTVPFHYSRADGLAASDFDAFVATPGHDCDTSEGAGLFIQDGRIVDAATRQARADALAEAERDRPWKEAIVRRMRTGFAGDGSLPSVQEVEASAGIAALTTSMRVGWEIAAERGLISVDEASELVRLQLGTIEATLSDRTCSAAESATLAEMAAEYRQSLRRRATA